MSKYDDYVRTVDAQQAELQDRYNEQERDTVDDNMPDSVFIDEDYQVWDGDIPKHKQVGKVKFIRAVRGDEPEQSDITPEERIAQLEADLKAADEEARKLRNMVCDEWRKDALSDEDAQVLELGRLMRQVRDKENVDVELYLWNDGSECISVNGHRVDYVMMDKPIAYLRSRLAPKPQRPTAESMIAELRNIKTSDDLWDWWQDTLEDWHAAGGEQ